MAIGSAIRAGKGFVEIYGDLTPLERDLRKVEDRMKSFGRRLSVIGAGASGIGTAVAAIGTGTIGAMTALAARFAAVGDVATKASDRTGIAASSLSELGYAAEQSGTDLATVEKGIRKNQQGIAGAIGGSKSLAEAYQSIGLSATALARLSPEDQFLTVAKTIGAIPNPMIRAAKAIQIFGKSGAQLLPLIISDIAALRAEARGLGLVISDEDAKNATALGDAIDRVKKAIGGIATQIGASVAVPFTKIADLISGIIAKISAVVKANRQWGPAIAAIAVGFVAVGSIISAIGVGIVAVGALVFSTGAIIGGVVTAIGTAWAALTATFAALLTPIGLLTAAVVGLGAYITYTALTATGSLSKLAEKFGSLGSTAITAWQGITDAVSAGDLELAGEIAFTALEVAWLTITGTIQQVWANVSTFFVNTWLAAVESIVKAGSSIYFGVAKYFDQLSNALVAGFDIAVTYIVGAIDTIQTSIAKAIIKAQEFFGLFSGEQSVQIQQTLDQDLASRSKGRQSGLDQRAGERGAALDQRAQQRQATADQFNTIVGEDFKRRQAKVDNSGLTAAQKRLSELQLSLSEKAAAAQEKAATAQSESSSKAEQAQTALATTTSEGSSVGTFVAGIANSITGAGASPLEDLGLQQVDLLASMDGRLREALQGEDE